LLEIAGDAAQFSGMSSRVARDQRPETNDQRPKPEAAGVVSCLP
jgi:hypothetical protein